MKQFLKKWFTRSDKKQSVIDDNLAYCFKFWINGGMELDMPYPFIASEYLTELEQYGVKQYLKQNGKNECFVWFYFTGIGRAKYVTLGVDLDKSFDVTDYGKW